MDESAPLQNSRYSPKNTDNTKEFTRRDTVPNFVYAALLQNLTWARPNYDTHSPPDGVKVEHMEQLEPEKRWCQCVSHVGLAGPLVSAEMFL